MDGHPESSDMGDPAAARLEYSAAARLPACVQAHPDRLAYREFDERQGTWRDYSWSEAAQRAARWQWAMRDAGLRRGDRVAIMGRNGIDWVLFDVAALGLGLVVVPLYREDRAENGAYILQHSGARLLLIDGPAQWDRLAPLCAQLPMLERIVSLQAIERAADGRVVSATSVLGEASADFVVEPVAPDALATIVYTSGTTGRPKGVMLSHRAMRSNASGVNQAFPIGPDDVFLSFLPLSHILERIVGCYVPMQAGALVVFARSVQQLGEDLQTQRPTVLVSVPRVYERVRARLDEQLATRPPVARKLFDMTVAVGWSRFQHAHQRGPWRPSHLLWPVLDALVARKVRLRLGGRLRAAACGSAALSTEVARTFIGLGVPLLQGYGLTECGGAATVNVPQTNDPASVGKALAGSELKIGANDELLIRGPSVMQGYWADPAASRLSLDDDGWLHTGDQAKIEQGFVYITGRIKEIIVLANGEKVPPADIEIAVSGDPLFEHVLIIGEGRPYLSALVVLNPERWADTAREAGIAETATDLRATAVQRILVDRIGLRLTRFPGYARVHRVAATLGPWNVDNGMLTPTMKLRRTHVLRQHEADVTWLYEGHGS